MASRLNKELKEVLGGEYGGPSLGYQDGEFIIYYWSDAPVGTDILGRGKTIEEALKDYHSKRG